MRQRLFAARLDFVAASVLTLLALFQVAMGEIYHQISGEAVKLAMLLAMLLALGLLMALAQLAMPPHAAAVARRAMVLTTAAAALALLFGSGAASEVRSGHWIWLLAPLAVLAVAARTVARALAARGDRLWARVRMSILVGALLFVGSEALLGQLRAQDVRWMPAFDAADAAADRGRRVTVLLLLDELNARSAEPLIGELREAGLVVTSQAVRSVGVNTAEVVPSLFDTRSFDGARPCGWTTICGRSAALNFSRITVARPDVDVAGFFHPYCAIGGLRSCRRSGVELALVDEGRWRCGLWRRLGWDRLASKDYCRRAYIKPWTEMADDVVEAALSARALVEGGVLFAHLPLPHPPAASLGLSLAQDYESNVQRAAQVLHRMLATARAAGLQPRVVIFSDHPLRQPIWCKFPPYQWSKCAPVDTLSDTQVPLIAAGEAAADLSRYDSNANVFDLAAAWKATAAAR